MRILVGMSGGVDSSTAAAILKEEGHQVIGISMRIWDKHTMSQEMENLPALRNACYGPDEEDIEDARKVAENLGIPFYDIDVSAEFRNVVLSYFKDEFLAGKTPNPCTRCNPQIKFGVLLQKAKKVGVPFDYFATGHYARVEYDQDRKRYLLKRARDKKQDQSYFLYGLNQDQLRMTLFPLGDKTKQQVRKLAGEFNLNVQSKGDSQDFFCANYVHLLGVEPNPGPILDTEGNRLGTHQGIWRYTVGQRRGIGISAQKPLYVIDIDREHNAIIVGEKEKLYKRELTADHLNWIPFDSLVEPREAMVKIRYRHKGGKATITPLEQTKVLVRFQEPQRAIAPGQAVVFYDNDTVLGGGTIE